MLRELWEQIRRIFGSGEQVVVEVVTRRNGRLVHVPVPVRVGDLDRLARRRR
jgi:hypothetical protein